MKKLVCPSVTFEGPLIGGGVGASALEHYEIAVLGFDLGHDDQARGRPT